MLLVRPGERVLLGHVDPTSCQLSAVDDLARLRLAAARFGWSVEVDGAPAELAELLELCGLGGLFLR